MSHLEDNGTTHPEPLQLLMCFDEDATEQAGVTLTSFLMNNKLRKINITVLTTNLEDESRARFGRLAADFSVAIHFVLIPPETFSSLPTFGHLKGRFATYFRLFAPKIYPETVEKILYLDCDVIVESAVHDLYESDIGLHPAAAAVDCTGQALRHRALRLAATHKYFNAGVLLINLKVWRRESVVDRVLKILDWRHSEMLCVDQDALNIAMENRVLYFSPMWNFAPFLPEFRSTEEYRSVCDGKTWPNIIHFAGGLKPWTVGRGKNAFADRYWHYRGLSPWHDTSSFLNMQNP